MINFTTAEQLEVEAILICKGKNFVFTPMLLNEQKNEILINDLDFKVFLDFFFPDHYTVSSNTISVDYNIFKILQLRYFRYNETVQILN